jgi:hypothetical protein
MRLVLLAVLLLAWLPSSAAGLPMLTPLGVERSRTTLRLSFERPGAPVLALRGAKLWEMSQRRDVITNGAILAQANLAFAVGTGLDGSGCEALPGCDAYLADVFSADFDARRASGAPDRGDPLQHRVPPSRSSSATPR